MVQIIQNLLSVVQDIRTPNSSIRKQMPKHIGLGISLQNCLRSKKFITYLNNLGHSICYNEVLRTETNWASEIMKHVDGCTKLPSNTEKAEQPFFTQAVTDNRDYGQKNPSQHITSKVLYQYGNVSIMKSWTVSKNNARRHSISPLSASLEGKTFIKKPPFVTIYQKDVLTQIFKLEKSEELMKEKLVTLSWILLQRIGNKLFNTGVAKDQIIPGWTGLRKCINFQNSSPTRIGSCRAIPASPTDSNVVYTMLINVNKMLIGPFKG